MESKIYSRAEIEAMLIYYEQPENQRDAAGKFCAIVRQLLAKVDEAAKIEELLKGCTINLSAKHSLSSILGNRPFIEFDEAGDVERDKWLYTFAVKYAEGIEWDSKVCESLHAALTSLVGGGK